MADNGYIKIYRKMAHWEWYSKPNVLAVFVHLLLNAAYRKTAYRGLTLQPGMCVDTVKNISEHLGISIQQTRTALLNLQLTNEITIKTTNKFSVFTINNYCHYQGDDKQNNKQSTNKQQTNQQTNNKPTLYIEEDKEVVVRSNVPKPAEKIKIKPPQFPPTAPEISNRNPENPNPQFDQATAMVFTTWQQNIPSTSRAAYDGLKRELQSGTDPELICEAIEQAAISGAANYRYVAAILHRCKQDGITTATAYRISREQYKNKKSSARTPPSEPATPITKQEIARRLGKQTSE